MSDVKLLEDVFALEQKRWARTGTTAVSFATLQRWHSEHTGWFFGTYVGDTLCAYVFGRQVVWPLNAVQFLAAYSLEGEPHPPHDPSGTALFIVSFTSSKPQAAKILMQEVVTRALASRIEVVFGLSRIKTRLGVSPHDHGMQVLFSGKKDPILGLYTEAALPGTTNIMGWLPVVDKKSSNSHCLVSGRIK